MRDVIAFLDDFKQVRDFQSAFPLLIADEAFREELFGQIRYNTYPYAEYSSWIAEHFLKAYPEYFAAWVPVFRNLLLTTGNHTVQRNLVHLFIHNKADLENDGTFLNRLMAFVESPDSLPALKVNAFKAIETQYIGAYPELIPELKLLMDLHSEDTRPSIQSLRRYFMKRYKQHLHTLPA